MICASIREEKMKNVLEKIAKIPQDYELLEVYVNEIEDFDFTQITAEWSGNLLVKITDISDVSLLKQLNLAAEISYIDIDMKGFEKNEDIQEIFKKRNAKLILSYHDFEKTLSLVKAQKILKKGRDLGADICKIIFTANSFEDSLIPLELLKEETDVITFCMGELGELSRIYAPHLGCPINFVPPTESWITADGQLTLNKWKKVQSALPAFEK